MSRSSGRRADLSEVSELEESRADEAVDLLIAAFESDPAYRYFCSAGRPGYRRRLGVVFRSGRAMQAASGQPVLGILSGERLAGLAIVQEPEADLPIRARLAWLLKVALLAGPLVTWRILRDMEVAARARPGEPHFYLPILAVHPDFQGSGCGRALLDAVQERSRWHPHSTGVCLETENPENVPFYEHVGYRVISRNECAALEVTTLFRAGGSG